MAKAAKNNKKNKNNNLSMTDLPDRKINTPTDVAGRSMKKPLGANDKHL